MLRLGIAVALAGCVSSQSVQCSDGRICPDGYTCDVPRERCISPDQISQCANGETTCMFGAAPGACRDGVCELEFCGDGIKNGPEKCDGDDLGTADCFDAGYYGRDGLRCNSVCGYDTTMCTGGTCGDGLLNGNELCEGPPPITTCVDQGFDAGALDCAGCAYSFDRCGRFGWIASPVQFNMVAIAAVDLNDEWAVGDGGVATHFDGATWNQTQTPTSENLIDVWAVAPADAWIVGTTGALLHWDGNAWSAMTGFGAGGKVATAVWSAAADRVYVATRADGVLRWDGATWTTIGDLHLEQLTMIRGASNDLWTATATGVVFGWTGTTWMRHDLAEPIQKLVVTSHDDVWLIGGQSTARLFHWDGATWTRTTDPDFAGYGAIAGTAPNDIWLADIAGNGRVKRFDGVGWRFLPGIFGAISGLYAIRAGQVVAVVHEVLAASNAYRIYGQIYSPVTAPPNFYGDAIYTGSADRVVIGYGAAQGVAVLQNGAWTQSPLGGSSINAVWGASETDVWAAGDSGKRWHYNGTTWMQSTTPTIAATLLTIAGSGAANVWAGGVQGTALQFDGASWTSHDIPALTANQAITAIGTSGATDVWAIVSFVAVYHWNGAAWNQVASLPPATDTQYTGLLVLDATHVIVTATTQQIVRHAYHGNETGWVDKRIPATKPIYKLSASSPADVFGVASSGLSAELVHFDGDRWSQVALPLSGSQTVAALSVQPRRVDLLIRAPTPTLEVRSLVRVRPWSCAMTEQCANSVDDDCDGTIDCP